MTGQKTCPQHDLTAEAANPVVGSIRFVTLSRILAGASAGFCLVVIPTHLLRHATHLSEPRQQVKIMRVCLLAPIYSILCLFQICFPRAAVYIASWLDVAQAICLASYFVLLCEYVSDNAEGRYLFFSTTEIKDNKRKKKQIDGAKWFQHRWIGVFQYPIIALLVAILTCITEALGVYCQFVSKPHYAKLWLGIVSTVSPAIAFLSVILVAVNLRTYMPHTKPLTKLISVKLIVGLAFIQKIIFWILESTNTLEPTQTMTYADKNIVLPALLSCLEMVPICLLVVWAYPVAPYIMKNGNSHYMEDRVAEEEDPTAYRGGFLGLKALLQVLNPKPVMEETGLAFKMLRDIMAAKSTNLPFQRSGREEHMELAST